MLIWVSYCVPGELFNFSPWCWVRWFAVLKSGAQVRSVYGVLMEMVQKGIWRVAFSKELFIRFSLSLSVQPLCHIFPAEALVLSSTHNAFTITGERVHLWRNKTAARQTLQRSASVSCLWKGNDHLVKEWSVQDHALRLPFLPLSSISNLNGLRLIVELFVWGVFTCVQVFMCSPDVPAAAAFLQS